MSNNIADFSPLYLKLFVTGSFGRAAEDLIKSHLVPADVPLKFAAATEASSTDSPRILPRTDMPFTHLMGLFSEHSNPAFTHFAQGIRDLSHSMCRRRHV